MRKRDLRNPVQTMEVGEWIVVTMWTRQDGVHNVFRHKDIFVPDKIAWTGEELERMLAEAQGAPPGL